VGTAAADPDPDPVMEARVGERDAAGESTKRVTVLPRSAAAAMARRLESAGSGQRNKESAAGRKKEPQTATILSAEALTGLPSKMSIALLPSWVTEALTLDFGREVKAVAIWRQPAAVRSQSEMSSRSRAGETAMAAASGPAAASERPQLERLRSARFELEAETISAISRAP
jgi:hypothetical protein